MIPILSAVKTTRNLLAYGIEIPVGTPGTVVEIWADGEVYEVELRVGRHWNVLTLEAGDIQLA